MLNVRLPPKVRQHPKDFNSTRRVTGPEICCFNAFSHTISHHTSIICSHGTISFVLSNRMQCSSLRALLVTAAVLLAVVSVQGTADPTAPQQRTLLQDALSNSNGCLATIPKCESGACATRNVMGTARWVCLRCLANYVPVVDDSGQDNIIQCVCPRGFFEPASTSTSCDRCTVGSYCPGGDRVENPTSRGTPMPCGTSLVTRNTGARSQADCVAPGGYAQTSPGSATACLRSEYAPAYNRLARCLKCQSGLEEPRPSNLTDGQRSSKRAVCMLPPGKFMSQGLVRLCPQGFYRETWVTFDSPNGTLCKPCRPGITTEGAGSGPASMCNVVIPGFGIAAIKNVTGPGSIPALPTNTTSDGGLPAATMCDYGYYSLGGYCAQCPSATTTRSRGAKAVEECMVPPGYCTTNGAMTQCDIGLFRDQWVMWSDYRALACIPCGDGIQSEPRDLDEHPLAANGSLVRATSTSCFINAGQGMNMRGFNIFVGQNCPEDTYGAAGKVYGWASAPCKPCARNLITDGLRMLSNASLCINPDGFGYQSEGASRCAPGFWSAKGSLRPCDQCPAGRTTEDNPSRQAAFTHCLVRPGFGVINSSALGLAAFDVNSGSLNETAQANLLAMECPVGYFGVGMAVGATCQKCPCGSSTQATGTTSAADCNVCLPGFGKATPTSTQCSPCPYGSYQPGGLAFCQSCPAPSFYAPVDGVGATVTVNSTTLFDGAVGAEACVPMLSQLSPEAGQAYFSPENTAVLALLNNTRQTTMAACFAACPADSCCMMQYDVTNKTCRIGSLPPVAFNASVSAGMQLLYKLPPSTMGSASSVELAPPTDVTQPTVITVGEDGTGTVAAKTIASGYYATCSIPAASAAVWQTAGTNLGPDARTFAGGPAAWDTSSTSRAQCERKCDESNVCWGFVYNAATGACLYRGGVDALATRSFFVMPVTGLQGNVSQQCPAVAPPSAAGGALVDLSCPAPCQTGLSCIAGQCGCQPGLEVCGTQTQPVCVNTTADNYNCGLCGRVCVPGHRCYDSICAEAPVACGSAKTFSGNEGNFTYSITIGSAGNDFNFTYDALSYPDRFNVFLPNGTRIFSIMSGQPGAPSRSCYCNLCKVNNEETKPNGFVTLPRPKGVTSVQVVVNGYCPGTAWNFRVDCAK